MNSFNKLPLEQRARDEAEDARISWNSGASSFLLCRTSEKYKHKSVAERRRSIEAAQNINLPEITDEILSSLYKFACEKYLEKCNKRYDHSSGFGKTSSEIAFAKTLESIIEKNPKLKHLEVYPSKNHSKDFPPNFKMVVGNYVPDLLIFGLKIKGSSAVAIEIDGDSHINKSSKDQLKAEHLTELNLFTFEIQNDQTLDFDYLNSAILSMYRLRNGSFNQQILRAKRLIWVKTITCQLSLTTVEEFVKQNYDIELNLGLESRSLLSRQDCPRKIKVEMRT